MGRPKKNAESLSAKEKIENAFWKILELEGYESITILRLTQETGLNRNSIYYHYNNIEDIAKKAMEHNMEQQDINKFASEIFSSHKDPINPELYLHIKRSHLFAGSNSSYLQSFLKTKLINIWIEYFSIDACKMSEVDCASIEFIATGIISIIGSNHFIGNPQLINMFTSSVIGKAAYQTLQNMPKKTEDEMFKCSRKVDNL